MTPRKAVLALMVLSIAMCVAVAMREEAES